jgi:gliding motility-associated-like protein
MVPTGFTPNGDGNNDLLIVHGKSKNIVRINEFAIYDRWGEAVYQNINFDINDTAIGWDGTFRGEEMDSGVYVWVLQVQFEDGSTDDFTGHTTLIR